MVKNLIMQSEIPVPILPPEHVSGCKFLENIVWLMDQYRDIRLIWTVLEAMIILFVLCLVIIMVYRVCKTNKWMRERFEIQNRKINQITELHKIADSLEKGSKKK